MTSSNFSATAAFDILVVGYGPSGATFANLMARRGYRVAVVDQATQIYGKPRAITADQEVMRIFQELGLAEEIAATTSPHPGTDFVGIDGQVIKRFYPAPPPHLLAWEPTWMFVQPELEATLRRGLEAQAGVDIFLGHEFIGCNQDADGVAATLRRLSDGVETTLTGRYLVGADGGRSAVRRRMNASIEDLAFDEWWMVVDAHLRGLIDLPTRCVQYCRPSRPGTYIIGPDKLRRWEIKLLPGETPADFATDEAVVAVLSEFVDTRQLALFRTAIYRFHALVVNHWRQERMFLMGDAAHQMPPFLGQGLCAGIRDAINLAWKIDGVERRGYAPVLLDSYEVERKKHVRTVVGHAKSFGLIIGELDTQVALERDRRLSEELASGQAVTVRQKFIPSLEAGLIGRLPDGGLAPGAGDLFVQPWIVEGDVARRLDDLLTPGFLMIATQPSALAWMTDALATQWQRVGGSQLLVVQRDHEPLPVEAHFVRERDGLVAEQLRALQAQVLLVRPDRYVFAAARNPEELAALLDQLERGLFAVVDAGRESQMSTA
ncbi:bifunctional 3-(3-hydroxy-phenyl)propionate/3-hydroxycinnamic acid hydroxylase [Variovorax sp. LT1R16]|uniref:bifunctional 3-(3-hydroxy-phenyl)propionate/3-hydroxycinnamic acid hydroxylase n=1 Tax=Variovorax sp. LT1R16 TaxID=3443728 RepID=UPI003F46EF2D